jgi:hypothetical protein
MKAFGGNGRCDYHALKIYADWDKQPCGIDKKTGKQKKCIECSHWHRIQKRSYINTPNKKRCVYKCANYRGFDPNMNGYIKCELSIWWSDKKYITTRKLGYRKCSDFTEKITPLPPITNNLLKRFEDLDIIPSDGKIHHTDTNITKIKMRFKNIDIFHGD